MAATLDDVLDEIGAIQRSAAATSAPRWPMIVLRTPKGWTGPKEVDGLPARARCARTRCRSRSSPTTPSTSPQLEPWLRSYRPEELFDEDGALLAGARRARAARASGGWAPTRTRTAGCCCATSTCPTSATTRSTFRRRPTSSSEATRVLGTFLRDVVRRNPETFRIFGPDETASNRLGAVFEATDRAWVAEREPTDDHLAPDGPRARGAERAPLPGLARGLPPDRQARPLQLLRGLHPHHRLDVQPAREVAEGDARHPVAPADRLAQLPAHVARLAPGPQRLLAPGSRLHRPRREQEGGDHPRLPAAGREHAALGRRPLPALAGLRERDRRRQAAGARLPDDGRGDRPLHARPRDLGVGVERRGRRAGRRARLRGRRPDARDARRRASAPRAPPRAEGAGRQRRRPDAPPAARASTRTGSPTRSSTRSSRATGRSSSPTTAIRGSSTG